jgi:excisionase family DNA binding protein
MVRLGANLGSPAVKTMKLLTIKEVCSRLSISRSKLHELIRSGRIRVVRIGKRGVRIAEAELSRFIEIASTTD